MEVRTRSRRWRARLLVEVNSGKLLAGLGAAGQQLRDTKLRRQIDGLRAQRSGPDQAKQAKQRLRIASGLGFLAHLQSITRTF